MPGEPSDHVGKYTIEPGRRKARRAPTAADRLPI